MWPSVVVSAKLEVIWSAERRAPPGMQASPLLSTVTKACRAAKVGNDPPTCGVDGKASPHAVRSNSC